MHEGQRSRTLHFHGKPKNKPSGVVSEFCHGKVIVASAKIKTKMF